MRATLRFLNDTRKSFTGSPLLFVLAPLPMLGAVACSSTDDGPTDPVGRGQQAVVERQCGTCHTAAAGLLAGADEPYQKTHDYPANLTPDEATGIGSWDDDTILKAILTGVDDEGEPLCPTMPHFADKGMTETEARNIIAYLRTIPAVSHENVESSCPPLKGGDKPEEGAAP